MKSFSQWWDEIRPQACNDSWYKECLKICRDREPAFLAIRANLTKAEQETLDLHIAACEELSFSLVYSVFRLIIQSEAQPTENPSG